MADMPSYAIKAGENKAGNPIYVVDVDAAYPSMLSELGVADVDQYWLEVAYQCIKMDMQAACGFGCEFRFKGGEGSKDRWGQKSHPAGKGAMAATQGLEARDHYKRLRGSIPG